MNDKQPKSLTMWGGGERGRDRLSIVDIVRNGTLSAELAAMLWLLVEAKTSILVASGPQFAGKTTVLTSVLDLAPPRYTMLQTRGRDEDFSFLNGANPESTYVLVPELSDHTPAYLWGGSLGVLFDVLGRGYSLGATMHSDHPQDVVRQLTAAPVSVPSGDLHRMEVVVNILMTYGERDMVRRVNRVTLLQPGPEYVTLAEQTSTGDEMPVLASESARQAVAQRAGVADLDASLAERRAIIEGWVADAPTSAEELRERVVAYYASRSGGTS